MSAILSELEQRGLKPFKKTATEWASPCPVCGGTDRFLVWPEKDNYFCCNDGRGGCGIKGDLIQFYRDVDHLSYQEAADKAGKPAKDFTPSKIEYKIKETYDYNDHNGKLRYQVVRMEPKTFRQRRPGINKDWIWNLKDTPLILFRMQEILMGDYVFYVEGEKDVLNLEKIGVIATTTPMGAGKAKKQNEEHSIFEPLAGKRLFIIPDNDKPGKEHAKDVANICYSICQSVKIVELPDLQPSGDVSDFIEIHGESAKTELKRLSSIAKEYHPQTNFISVTELEACQYEARRHIISDGILPENGQMLLAGESGVGKSMLRLEIAIHIAMGMDWLNFEIPCSKRVVMFQFENSERIEQYRYKKMREGLELSLVPGSRLAWVKRSKENRPDLTLKKDQDRLLELVKESGGEVIIYDCLSNLHSANENDNVKMRNVLDVITDINAMCGTSSIVIHHFGKPGANDEQAGISAKWRTRGASSILDWADCALAYSKKSHENKILRILEAIKIRDAAEIKPILLERNGNFMCKVIDEDTLCPPHRVRELLESIGGEVKTQSDLVGLIMSTIQCSDRSAKEFVRNAVKMLEIIETEGANKRSKGYRVR